MRYVKIQDAKAGMRLAYNIYDEDGHTLICKGSVLSDFYIRRLNEFGFSGVYITDALSEDIKIEPIITSDLRTEGLVSVRKSDIDGCKGVARKIVDQVLRKDGLSLDLKDLRSFDGYTYAHSVNVAVLSCIIGFGLKMNEEALGQLVMAGLLHDLGKLTIPKEILNKPTRLTNEEYAIMKTHATLSYEMIKGRWDISSYVKTAVHYHHENVDGSGYPDGIEGEQHTIYTKILHVADVYDALVSRRPYKAAYSPYEACEYLMGGGGIMFDPNVVESLLLYVPLFPKGTMVKLSDGRDGIIVDNSGTRNLRPLLRLLDGTMIDLQKKEYLNITILHETNEDVMDPQWAEEERKEMLASIKNFSIMIIDDMLISIQSISGFLEKTYELTCVTTYEEAVKSLRRNGKQDLLIIDMDMPRMNGIQVCAKLKELLGADMPPVLFIIEESTRELVSKCRRAGAAGYIVRPFKPTYVKAEIKRVLTGTNVAE